MPVNHQLSMKRYFLIIILFLLTLNSLRFFWLYFNNLQVQHLNVQNGVLDLREFDFTEKQTLPLDGEWSFTPNSFQNNTNTNNLIKVPGDWRDDLPNNTPYGYGTYHLKVLLPSERSNLYGIRLPGIPTASEVFINGKSVSHSGKPGESNKTTKPRVISKTIIFHSQDDVLEINIQVANFIYPKSGGITKSIQFGAESAVNRLTNFSHTMQLMSCLIFILHALYAVILYFIGARKKELFYFILLLFFAILTILLDDDRLLLKVLPINFEWSVKFIYIAYIGLHFFMLKFVKHLTTEFKENGLMRLFMFIFAFLAFCITFVPFPSFPIFGTLIHLQGVATFIIIFFLITRHLRNGDKDAIFLLLAITSILNSALGGLFKNFWGPPYIYYPFDMIIAIICLAAYLFRQYLNTAAQTKELADQLQKVDKIKDDFLANTSHELRNPLHGMITIAQTILEDPELARNKKYNQNLTLLITIGHRLSFIVNDLLDITRLKEKRIHLHKQPIDLLTIITGAMDMIRLMIDDREVRFTINVPKHFPPVMADENRLIQILFNLLHNAVKFTNIGEITVSAVIQGDKAAISIKDTGIGMEDELLQRIFVPFEQGVFSLKNRTGVGLGLRICKQLIELHEGEISVRSTKGSGSVFTFTLPLATNVSQTEVAAANDHEPSESHSFSKNEDTIRNHLPVDWLSKDYAIPYMVKEFFQIADNNSMVPTYKARILIVDDDPINLKLISNLLSANYEVFTALNGEEALSKLAAGDWDLIISDVMMPHMSGYELTLKIREKFPISQIPVLLLTARSQPEDIYSGFLAGANDYVTKPIETLELTSRVFALTKVKQSVQEQLRMEAAWLQAQIQPHFLFNTLNTIASLSEIDQPRMLRLLDHFGNYLRRSFDVRNSYSLVPIEHELELLRSYLYIEKERFGDRLKIEWDVDEHISFEVPPLSIQPIVENAVKHGVLKKANGGVVNIHLSDAGNHFEITVRDNGVGMDRETFEKILISHPQQRGIGLLNTNRRLKQLYDNGLVIDSELGKGTTIHFKIPKTK